MRPTRWVVRRGLYFERWRVIAKWKIFYGLGQPKFEFEFRLGFPKKIEQREMVLEDDGLDPILLGTP